MSLVRKIMMCALLFVGAVFGKEINYNKLQWNERTPLIAGKNQNKQLGLAGAFSGTLNDFVVFAGGANFSEKSLIEGGRKIYHDDIFLLSIKGEKTKLSDVILPKKMAHGASVTISIDTADGKKTSALLFIGGESQDAEGKVVASNKIYVLSLDSENSIILDQKFPDLPVTFVKGAAVVVGSKIYVIGGKMDNVLSSDVYVIDYKEALKKPETKWAKTLSYPGFAREELIAVAQQGGFKSTAAFYIFGGFGIVDGKTKAFTDGFAFIPSKNKIAATWSPISEIKPKGQDSAISVFGGTGMAIGTNSIVILGGYNKEIFEKWLAKVSELKDKPAEFNLAKESFFSQNPEDFKWNKQVLVYNTIVNEWTSLGETPFLANCGAALQKISANDFLLINGEIKPGVRTNQIIEGHFVNKPSFGLVNWGVLIIYFIGMLLVGAYFMKRESGAGDFMTGGGRIPWWAAGVSIFATMLSSLSFMAIPAMTFQGDWRVFTAAITILLCVPIVTCFYLPFFRRLKLISAYEYLEARFNVSVRAFASFMFIVFMVVRIGIVLYLPAVALSAVTGIDTLLAIVLIGVITIIYCAMGGIEAVIWGDFIQGLVLVGGAILALIWLIFGTDGSFINIAENGDKFRYLDFAFDYSEPVFWVILFGGLASNIISYTSDQSVVQRYLTTKDEAAARKSLWLNGILSIPVSMVLYGIGTALYTFYKTNPDGLNVAMESANQVFPHFMMSKMPMGLAGLLIAAVFSATMSTLSSNINSAATAYTTDFYKRFFNKNADDHACLKIVRFSTVLIGLLGIFCAYLVYLSQNEHIFNSFNAWIGLLVSGLGGLFAMGIFIKRISGESALIGYIVALISLFFIKENTSVNGWLFGLIGLAISIGVAYILSFIFPNKKNIENLTFSTIRKENGDAKDIKKH